MDKHLPSTAAQPELLPLPEPLLEFACTVGGKRIDYTADQMQAYACTAVSAALQAQAGEVEGLRAKVATAYGWLWHVNNEPAAPVPLLSSEQAAYEARKILRDTMTHDQRGKAINSVAAILAARTKGTP